MTVDVRDILIKAAEDVQSGMWCQDQYFSNGLLPGTVLSSPETLQEALKEKRCALGSIAVATALLGGTWREYDYAATRAEKVADSLHGVTLVSFNDDHLPDDPFEAGQQLAELFRQAADA